MRKNTDKPIKSKDIPATVTMLFQVQAHLEDKIETSASQVKSELKAEITGVKSELQTEMASFKTELKNDISEFRAEVKQSLHEMRLLMEEQNARNIFVLDGLNSLYVRQDRVEKKLDKLQP